MKYELNRLYQGDCMDYMRGIPDGFFELAIVDPPYGIDINKSGRLVKEKGWDYKNWDISVPNDEYFNQLFRVSKNQIIWGGNYMPIPNTKTWLMWDKLQPEGVSFASFEMAWTSIKGSCKKFEKRPQGDVRIHPTQKPIALYEWLLKNYANEGDKILDTHLGSASSIIACIDMGFDFMGIELDEEYYLKGLSRVNTHLRQGDITRSPKFQNLQLPIINDQILKSA